MSDRMAGLLAKHYYQDLNGNYMNSLGASSSMSIVVPPVLSAYLSKRAAAGQSSSLMKDNSPTPSNLPAALPIQCGSNFGSGLEEALRCQAAIATARGQQAQAGAPVTTQEQITGIGAAPAAPTTAAPAPAAANPKDALKQGLKGLLGK